MQRNGWGNGWCRKVISWSVLLNICTFTHLLAQLLRNCIYISNYFFHFSQYYTRFKSYCCEAYNILRKSSSLILNLFNLMRRSNIPDISSEENGGLKVINWLRVEERVRILAKSRLAEQSKWLISLFCVVHRSASGEIPAGSGRWGCYTFLPGSNQWECQRFVPSNGWDHP